MFFWIALPIVLIAFVCAFVWGVRGYGGRVHRPGTQYLIDTKPPKPGKEPRRTDKQQKS